MYRGIQSMCRYAGPLGVMSVVWIAMVEGFQSYSWQARPRGVVGSRQGMLGVKLRGGTSILDQLSMRGPVLGHENTASILLVRHGQTEWNVQGRYQGQMDSALTPRGRAEAKALGERLRQQGRDISSVWSSDLPRASDTAHILVAELQEAGRKYDVLLDPRLRERSFGILEGLTREECRRKHPEEIRKFSADGDYAISGGGESRSTLVQRAEEALLGIAKRSMGQTCLVVTHGAVVSTLMRYLLGIPFSMAPDKAPLADLQIRNTCICELRYHESGKWTVLSLGDVAHTEQLHRGPASSEKRSADAGSIEQV